MYTYGGGVPAYVLDYTANTVLQELAWSGTCCSYSQREVERDGSGVSGREREKGKGAKDSSGGESRNFAHEIITLCSFLGGGKGGGLELEI